MALHYYRLMEHLCLQHIEAKESREKKMSTDNTPINMEKNESVANANRECMGNCFFAYIDILGFKSVVKNNSLENLKNLVKDFFCKCQETGARAGSIIGDKGTVFSETDLRLDVSMVSDAIYLRTKINDDKATPLLCQFDDLMQVVNKMTAYGLAHGLPLRGVVTYGEIFEGGIELPPDASCAFEIVNHSVYGRALVDTYEFESKMDWSGVILLPQAWAKLKGEFAKIEKQSKTEGRFIKCMRSNDIKQTDDLFNHYPYLVWYDVPFKNDKTVKAIVFNWNYRTNEVHSKDMIINSFTEYGKNINQGVAKKILETLKFYDYTKIIESIGICGATSTLPVPDDYYIGETFAGIK